MLAPMVALRIGTSDWAPDGTHVASVCDEPIEFERAHALDLAA